jgi:hypothetical protein
MSRMIACVAMVLVLAAGDSGQAFAKHRKQTPAAPAQPAAPQAKELTVGDFIIADPVRCKNLMVFPVLSTQPKEEDRYITLEEGLKSHKVDVYEVGASPPGNSNRQNDQPNPSQLPENVQREGGSGDVNHLMVANRSAKPLYLMPGEIILGGKQDRCVAKECVIPVDVKPVKIEVYCVEHGRWNQGQVFGEKAGNLGKEGRVAVQEGKAQTEVWEEVQRANDASGVRPSTGAFTANYTDPKILKKIESYTKDVEKPVAEHRQVVGAIVAVNNKLEVVDVFGSTPLFRKVWPKLLKGYALDAAVVASKKGKKTDRPPTLKDAEAFFRDVMESQVQKKSDGIGGLVVTKRESERVRSFSAADKSQAAPEAQGAFGGSLHGSGYSK